MKKHLSLMLGLALSATFTFYGCKKDSIIEPEKELETFSGKPNASANVPNWESYAKSELFPYGDGTQWKTLIPWDGFTIQMAHVQLREGYAVGYAVAVIGGTPEYPTGEVGTLLGSDPGNSSESASRIFAYTRIDCGSPTVQKITSTWSSMTFNGKDDAGETFTVFLNQFQQTNSWLVDHPEDKFDVAEKYYDRTFNPAIQKVKITRIGFQGFGHCTLGPPKLVTFKLAALKDSQGVIHYYIAHPNFKEPSITPPPSEWIE
ncbi:hypothetical protein ASU31_13280 [Pedobacter ginsenosidimutans]|uniref:Uncharacterized protein n=1 Tax=Pedobacter ginsenosidimutans TaxID=687842 RepID=A0A0T5VP63_9SPHI|nr:hypothetical protein [Pedobacter ginsenosidimutans]KRT15633.1 hypothetical protein ASU31_13280 [Pedobacter ginsenosidimutans]